MEVISNILKLKRAKGSTDDSIASNLKDKSTRNNMKKVMQSIIFRKFPPPFTKLRVNIRGNTKLFRKESKKG
jgi:hypothetical protein